MDGAILNTASLTVAAESSANVLLRDAALNGAVSFGTGTSLELQRKNTISGSLTLGEGVSLMVTLDNSHLASAALTLTGSVSTGTLSLNLNVAEERASGMYSILSVGRLSTADAWIAENVNVQGSGAAAGATFADLLWQDGTLYYAASPVWSNYSGSMVWSSTDANWNNGSAFRAGQEVIFMDRGAGEVQLVGELPPASIHVQNTEGNDYTFTGSGKLSGETTLTKTGAGELTISTANDYTGKTDLQGGTLNVHHSTALGATATGEATLTTAAGTTLKVANSSHLVLAGDYDLAGNVDVAEGATLELQKDGRAAGTLSGSGTLQASNSQVSVDAISNSFTGNLKVEGKGAGMSIASGSYTGTATLSVAGGTLTFGAKANITLNAGGQLVLQSWDDAVAGVTANNITVRQGATLAAKSAIAALGDIPEAGGYALPVELNCSRLTLNAGATLEAEGACFDLNNGVLTLAVTSATTDKIELVLAENAVYTGSEQIALFVNVGQGIFAYNGINTSTGEESLYTLNAADYFTGMGINESTQLVYDSTTGTVYLQGVVSIPEPASATLSLIALAALAMRRRRK
ncbi:MAG: autotransporter-associated beta strand repeat-containing protein [Akkermansia sp.]|nr:autotransporter-associated beta strand repeat-containing protein [Akkermansia sp.]